MMANKLCFMSDDNNDFVFFQMLPEQRQAFLYLQKICIDWGGKPITDRDDANARRESLSQKSSQAD